MAGKKKGFMHTNPTLRYVSGMSDPEDSEQVENEDAATEQVDAQVSYNTPEENDSSFEDATMIDVNDAVPFNERISSVPSSVKIVKPVKEFKSKRLQLLVSESTYKALKKSAKSHGVSMNEFVNQAISNILQTS